MMAHIRPDRHGFSIVELLVATAVTSLLVIIVLGFLTNALINATRESARSDLLLDAQNTLDNITQDIRTSSNAYDTVSLPDDNAPSDGWDSDDTTLILATAALDTDKNILFADALHYTSLKNNTIYFVSDRTLYRRTLAADDAANAATTSCPKAQSGPNQCPPDSVMAQNVNSFSVAYYDGNGEIADPTDARSVQVTLNLETERYGQTITASYATRGVFRNQ